MAPDGDEPTVHIRCGSDIFPTLRVAGFVGELLEFSDPVCMGPVPDIPDLLQVRARFIDEAFERSGSLGRLLAEADALEAARASAARIVLWSEHDGYDQLVLARVLDALAGRANVELICAAGHPGPERFIGLGQLTAAELLELWPGRVAVGAEQSALGTAVWQGLRSPKPCMLHAMAVAGTPAVPPMAGALHRHLQELPWVRDGLSLTERLVLQAVREGAGRAGEAFVAAQILEPLPFMGDTMVWAMMRDLAAAREPALAIGPGPRWPERTVALTASGRHVLEGKAGWQRHGLPERWVGGVRVADWWWDGRPVQGHRSRTRRI